jgi:hypothetical protein
MAQTTIKFETVGFDKLEKILNPSKIRARFRNHIKKATLKNMLIGSSEIIRAIHSGKFKANSPLTAAIKGSDRPLVDTGALAGSVSGRAEDWDEAVITVNRKVRGRSKKSKKTPTSINIAAILYYGATIKVTDAMRRYFFALAGEYEGIHPLNPRTKVIVIPPRKYMDVATTKEMNAKYQLNWLAAVKQILLGVD